VLAAVKFDDQALVYTTEIHDVWTYRILAPELGCGEFSTPYPHPKMAFGIGLTPAQIARKGREYGSSQGSPFANSARYRNPHPPLSLINKGRGYPKSNLRMYKLE